MEKKEKKELIVEIGTEEIPAGFLSYAVEDLKTIAEREFREALLDFGKIKTFGTPRRLTLHVRDLFERQRDKLIEITGPPKRIAFDEEGNPTKAAFGFAKSQGVDVKDLVVVEREKGDLVAIRKKIKGEKTERVLRTLLSKIILSIPFRKSMRWGSLSDKGEEISFVRPIRWLFSLYGGRVLPFKVGDIKSTSKTVGHRFISPKPFSVKDWESYVENLEKSSVILDQKKRMEIIKDRVEQAAEEVGGFPLEDEELLGTVTNLVEYPMILRGRFSEEFLELPKEVLISVMKNNQKYFPVLSSSRKDLLPYFVFVGGTPVENTEPVIGGNERVIRARFTDAKFFFEEDTKTPLSHKVE